MNNATMYGKLLYEKFLKWDALVKSVKMSPTCAVQTCMEKNGLNDMSEAQRLAFFACMPASVGFQFEIGEIVKYDNSYAKVTGYYEFDGTHSGVYGGIVLNSSLMSSPTALRISETGYTAYKTKIPDELYEFVASEIRKTCPLKEATCAS